MTRTPAQTANPQGKGLTPVLDSLSLARQQLNAPAKPVEQIGHELFTSMFVLSSRIKFKPVTGCQYWLYRKHGEFRLSLIAPEQWQNQLSGDFIGSCELHNDLTWTLQLSEHSLNDAALMTEICRRREQFEQQLQQAERIDDLLPVYAGGLPFYSRILASALAYSLQQSMHKSGISGLNYREAKLLLPRT